MVGAADDDVRRQVEGQAETVARRSALERQVQGSAGARGDPHHAGLRSGAARLPRGADQQVGHPIPDTSRPPATAEPKAPPTATPETWNNRLPSKPEKTRTYPAPGFELDHCGAPTITSSNPSPFTSPAPATAIPKESRLALPVKVWSNAPVAPENT